MVGDIERVLTALNRAQVRYLVAGGVAVVLHGYLRTTADLDLVVQLDQSNLRRALQALQSLGYKPRAPVAAEDFADEPTREAWIREKGLEVFSMWSNDLPRLEVDIFVREPFDFETVWARAERVPLRTCEARVVPRETLIEMKRLAGRPRDLEDADALEALGQDQALE